MLISAEIESTNKQLRKLSGESLLREQGKAIFLDWLMERFNVDPSARPVSKRPTLIDSAA